MFIGRKGDVGSMKSILTLLKYLHDYVYAMFLLFIMIMFIGRKGDIGSMKSILTLLKYYNIIFMLHDMLCSCLFEFAR